MITVWAPDRPAWKNALGIIGAILASPFLILFALGFGLANWISGGRLDKPVEWSAKRAAQLLSAFENDQHDDDELDEFLNCRIADPKIQAMAQRVNDALQIKDIPLRLTRLAEVRADAEALASMELSEPRI